MSTDAEPKRGPGRPALAPEDRRSVKLTVRVRQQLAAELERLASEQGVPAGELHHEILQRAVQRRARS